MIQMSKTIIEFSPDIYINNHVEETVIIFVQTFIGLLINCL